MILPEHSDSQRIVGLALEMLAERLHSQQQQQDARRLLRIFVSPEARTAR